MDSMLKWEQRPRKVTFLLCLLILCFTVSLWHNCLYVTNYEAHQSVHPRWRWDHEQDTPVDNGFPAAIHETSAFNQSDLDSYDFQVLADLNNFHFVIQNRKCDNNSDLFLLVFVHSAPSHIQQRQIIRETWGRKDGVPGLQVIFLLGKPNNTATQDSIKSENARYNDIIQGNFVDSYRNLTYKHIMGLKWITYFCQHAAYVLKADDDVFIDTIQLAQYVRSNFGARAPKHLMFCFTIQRPYVKRSQDSKWYVSFKEYPSHNYPTYCSGWSILMSPDVVFELYTESTKHHYFWIDDVHVTGILAQKIGIKHKSFNGFLDIDEYAVHRWLKDDKDVYPPMFGYPDASLETIRRMWEKTKRFYDRNKLR